MAPTPTPDRATRATVPASAPGTTDPAQVLRQVFGYGAFRGPQQEIVDHVVGGGSALVLMPTGGGKSLCYQIPALCRSGVGVVVSPLIALMQDQVEGLRQAGVRAAALNSSLEASEASSVWRRLEQDPHQTPAYPGTPAAWAGQGMGKEHDCESHFGWRQG